MAIRPVIPIPASLRIRAEGEPDQQGDQPTAAPTGWIRARRAGAA